MSDLRTEVAEQLYRAFFRPGMALPIDVSCVMAATKGFSSDRPIDKAWLAVADECIRQMKWARTECPFEWAGVPDPATKAGSPDAILTLAPEDWKP